MSENKGAELLRERWDRMAQQMRQDEYLPFAWLAPLVEAISRHPTISRLFPYTSHDTLCLSRTTRYPYSNDCPHVIAVADGLFRVSTTEGESGVAESVARIASDLPPEYAAPDD